MMAPRIYLAGPEVFLPDPVSLFAAKSRICADLGLQPIVPYDEAAPPLPGPAGAAEIYRQNLARMNSADAIIANLTPFRGPGADPGTAFELGYMAALGRPCFAYSNAPGLIVDRMRDRITQGPRGWIDGDGLTVEDFGLPENLMLAVAAEIVVAPDARPLHDLQAFEICARGAARRLIPSGDRAPRDRPGGAAR